MAEPVPRSLALVPDLLDDAPSSTQLVVEVAPATVHPGTEMPVGGDVPATLAAPEHPLVPVVPRLTAREVARQLTMVPLLRSSLSVLKATVKNAWGHRCLGLAAEAAFWQLVSLPAALVGLVGLLGYVGREVGPGTVDRVQSSIIDAASQALTPSTINSSLTPLLDQLLHQGKASLVSIGFIVSFWSGSSAVATYVNTITIAYDQRDVRGPVRSRLLALRLYVYALLIGVVLLPALVVGPGLLREIGPDSARGAVSTTVDILYWPVVVILSLMMLASLYHRSLAVRTSWPSAFPGAIGALGLWIAFSYGLRYYVTHIASRTLDLGVLSAPIAVLLFFYVTALAVLLGAELNAELDRRVRARRARRVAVVQRLVSLEKPALA